MNRFRWLMVFVMLGNLLTIWKSVSGQQDYGTVWMVLTWAGLLSQIAMFCFMKSPFRRDGQGGNLSLPIRQPRRTQRN